MGVFRVSDEKVNSRSQPPLSERAQQLLKALVERYIEDGQPVGSRTLSRAASFGLSPASIRNVMSDLEELGYLRAPHTSAGRIPTARGYRFFIDSLLTLKPLPSRQIEVLRQSLESDYGTPGLVQSVSRVLSGITHLAGIVTVPRSDGVVLRQVEFLPLSDHRVLVILVVNEQEVQNRVIHTDRSYSSVELTQAANYLNRHFAGRDVCGVRSALLEEMEAVRTSLNEHMATVVEMASKAFDQSQPEDDYVVAGETNLMDFAELSNVEQLRQLFESFNRKRDILRLFDQSMCADGVQIFIGEEAGYGPFEHVSMVTAPYRVDGRPIGVLGVIGPTRMAYERIIPIVEVTAKLMAAALNSRS